MSALFFQIISKFYRTPIIYYYRDNLQKEADVVEEQTFRQLRAFEIKSARRYNDSFGAGLRYFKKLFGDEVVSMDILYDGDEDWNVQSIGCHNVRDYFFGQ